MTWALCLNCGEIKFGAICPCPKCEAGSTGNMGLDIAFSDHRFSKDTLRDFGEVIAAIHDVSSDDELCFWTFIHFVSANHSEILDADIAPDVRAKCDAILARARIPEVIVRPSPRAAKDADEEGNAPR